MKTTRHTTTTVIVTTVIAAIMILALGNTAADTVDQLIKQAYGLLNKSEKYDTTDAEGEILGDYLQALIETNDPRIAPLLLDVMVSETVGGLMIAKGLLMLGDSVLPYLLDSLDSPRVRSQAATASYLASIAEMDSSGTFFTADQRRIILEKSVTLLGVVSEDTTYVQVKSSVIRALGIFGDHSTIPLLESIVQTDTDTTQTGVYINNRRSATRAIERIKKRK